MWGGVRAVRVLAKLAIELGTYTITLANWPLTQVLKCMAQSSNDFALTRKYLLSIKTITHRDSPKSVTDGGRGTGRECDGGGRGTGRECD